MGASGLLGIMATPAKLEAVGRVDALVMTLVLRAIDDASPQG
jgi:hypothetical protein